MVRNNSDRITQLEETVQQLKNILDLQREAHENIVTELQTTKRQLTETTNMIKQMLNDTDTKIMIEQARREREIQNLKATKQEEPTTKPNNIEIPMATFSGETNEHPKFF